MNRKIVSGLVLATLLVTILSSAFSIQLPLVSGTIYIRPDGSIDPDDGRIVTEDKVYYTFTQDIFDDIVVERSNITIDGAGYVLDGSETTGAGLQLFGINNVTIRNTNIKKFDRHAIVLAHSSNNVITRNNVTDNWQFAIILTGGCINNIITRNRCEDNWWGIYCELGSSNNRITDNHVMNNENGIVLQFSSCFNFIYHNNLVDNTKQVVITAESVGNILNDDYPYGGNYWSDYDGDDTSWGENQNLDGADLIGDTPYIIDEDNLDRYPLMKPWSPDKSPIIQFPDLNLDGKVGIVDLFIVANHFGETRP